MQITSTLLSSYNHPSTHSTQLSDEAAALSESFESARVQDAAHLEQLVKRSIAAEAAMMAAANKQQCAATLDDFKKAMASDVAAKADEVIIQVG